MSTNDKKSETTEPQKAVDTHTPDYAELAKAYEMLKVENDRLKTQLRQAIDIAQRANDKEKARGEAEKERLVVSIMQDSRYSKEDLMAKDLNELRIIRTAVDNATEKTFASIAAEIDEQRKGSRQPKLTVGQWDRETQKWTGGSA